MAELSTVESLLIWRAHNCSHTDINGFIFLQAKLLVQTMGANGCEILIYNFREQRHSTVKKKLAKWPKKKKRN